jgi:hypothetical protein
MLHPQLRTTYVFAGPLRSVEADGRRAILRVETAGGRARRFCGRTVTLDLAGSRIAAIDPDHDDGAGLHAGQMVTVRARLPRRLEELPSVLSPRSVLTLGPLG